MVLFIYNILKYGHLLSMATLVGSFVLVGTSLRQKLKRALLLASFGSLLTGVGMVGIRETILDSTDLDLNHFKIAYKLLLTLAIILIYMRESQHRKAAIRVAGVLSLGITAIAVFWI